MPNEIKYEYEVRPNRRIFLAVGDITLENTDAIVNAANSDLKHGGGVAGAIVRRGGAVIQAESDRIGKVGVGMAAHTSAGNLSCRYVIHAVGPRWGEGDEEKKLANAVISALEKGAKLGVKTISLPPISSGIFGFPKDRCAEILLEQAVSYLQRESETSVEEIRFCIIDKPSFAAFEAAWKKRF